MPAFALTRFGRYFAGKLIASAAGAALLLAPQVASAQGLAQPASLKPGQSPYPQTTTPASASAIIQPSLVQPSPATPAQAIAGNDRLTRTPVSVSTAAPAALAAPPLTAAVAVPPLATTKKPTAGNSLWSQLLGTAKPAAPVAAVTRATAAPAITNPFQLTTAEVPVAGQNTDDHRQPTIQDIEAAKAPATSMTISRPGTSPQAAAPSSLATAASQSPPVGTPPVPTLPAPVIEGVATSLWRPFAMTTDAPALSTTASSANASSTSKIANADAVDPTAGLLQPFYATNSPVDRPAAAPHNVAPSAASLTDAVAGSQLGRQLSMANTDDYRTAALAKIEAEASRETSTSPNSVTVTWPLMANPFTMTDTPPATAYAATPGNDPIARASFQQDTLPAPGAASDDQQREEANNNDDDEKKSGDGKSLAGARTIGTAPQDSTLNFLRTQTVLLKPGKSQFDIGLEYTLTENNFPILISDGAGNVIGVDDVEFKGRELVVPMELRHGILPRLQGFVQVPVGWANVQAAINDYDEYENDGGVGDIGFGLTAQLRDAYKDCPYLIGTVAGLAPTGGDPFGVFGTITPNAPSLGNGFWAISGNLLWVQTRYDPVVVYYGFGSRYQFEREYRGIEFQPGVEFNYTLGTGFAVNERVTLSAQFFGAYIEELKANGERVEGTIQEPMNLRLAATLAKPCNRLVEPFVTFGLTDDAISANFGITWTY